MAKLIYVPLGCSLRSQLAEKLSQQPLGEGVLVLPNRLLTDDVRSKYANVETMGMDTLAGKLMNLNGGTDYKELSRRSQELIVQDIIDYMMENKQLAGMTTHKQLEYFGSLAHKTGFVKAMTSLVSQLSRCGATKDDIYGQIQKSFEEDELKGKDLGVCNFYLLYRQYLENNKWYDLEGKYRLAEKMLEKQDCKIPWKHIYICDFFSLDQVQINFLQALAKHVDDLVISMSYEGRRVSSDEKVKYESITKFMRASTNTVNALKILGATVASLAAEELGQAPAGVAMRQLRHLGHAPAPVPAREAAGPGAAPRISMARCIWTGTLPTAWKNSSSWGGPGGSALFAFFCNFLLQVPAEYDINGVLKCFEREVLRRKPAQERTGRRLQAGLSGAAVFARELPRGNARTGRPPLSGKRVRGCVPRSWVVPRKPYAFRPK